ncbi:palmitoyltransferase PFA3 [Metarhizium album ARSEF 1941]|uniref:Palmitoyltransferase n=1 Tax=Metarhizium album (strain ARSEF 1941) TaxID=1081103 RepID=A0A0B2WQ53_METAS|nr:palmitoyltransferase PFA3 [Metarhizium album ARSEF 1941]KHN95627.1 palmitoyltransferase PFA3 [Metarhizium album ARSEF 1941]
MPRRCARTIVRACCVTATYIPLMFVYGLTTWAVWVVVEIGSVAPEGSWLGSASSAGGVVIYLLLNWSYTTAVFTDPGSTTNRDGYGLLPTTTQNHHPRTTSFTVKSNGEVRFCKKCQARKPDRAHHCSTCRRCVLKMDHHCPWLATCLGLRNYKAFLLFLMYTTTLCLYAFAVSGTWVWSEVVQENVGRLDALLPVNFIVLSIVSGIVGVVVGVFTGWHVVLALRGQTTIECLEKTRYLSPLKQPYRAAHNPANRLPQAAQQFVDFHTNALPGITRPEEGEERRPSNDHDHDHDHPARPVQLSYDEHERLQSRRRHEEYLDAQDSAKLPSAFDLGWRRNLQHLLGPSPWLWAVPICNTTGDGWSWEASPEWLEARDRIKREREEQRAREMSAGWGGHDDAAGWVRAGNAGSSRGHRDGPTARARPSKADLVLGRDPNLYADGSQGMRMQRLSTRGKSVEDELLDTDDEDDEDGAETRDDSSERRASGPVSNGQSWTRGGASGVLRQAAPGGAPGGARPVDDQGVD